MRHKFSVDTCRPARQYQCAAISHSPAPLARAAAAEVETCHSAVRRRSTSAGREDGIRGRQRLWQHRVHPPSGNSWQCRCRRAGELPSAIRRITFVGPTPAPTSPPTFLPQGTSGEHDADASRRCKRSADPNGGRRLECPAGSSELLYPISEAGAIAAESATELSEFRIGGRGSIGKGFLDWHARYCNSRTRITHTTHASATPAREDSDV